MQSEVTSHIGLQGTHFCRICLVRGKDTGGRGTSVAAEIDRRREFMQIGKLRCADDTRQNLKEQLDHALNSQWGKVEKLQTSEGVKDRHLLHFLDALREASDAGTKAGLSPEALFAKLEALRDTWPADLFNPAFAFEGFDPHAHSPVEILHVFLLGIVKYLWRDAVARLNHTNREILKVRLTSLDVRGLGVAPINGHTLVQFAGSLTGRDFRVIAQVGTSVLHGLLDDGLYAMWVALGRLTPLVFQPRIPNIQVYIVSCQILPFPVRWAD